MLKMLYFIRDLFKNEKILFINFINNVIFLFLFIDFLFDLFLYNLLYIFLKIY
jgi:hypothetical protein